MPVPYALPKYFNPLTPNTELKRVQRDVYHANQERLELARQLEAREIAPLEAPHPSPFDPLILSTQLEPREYFDPQDMRRKEDEHIAMSQQLQAMKDAIDEHAELKHNLELELAALQEERERASLENATNSGTPLSITRALRS